MSLALEASSLEYVRVPVTAAGLTITDDPVEIAFTAGQAPTSPDWKNAAWDNGAARILVGPAGDITLTPGIYRIWVRVVDNPEVPVLRAGFITIR